tara:strand:+ start:852 stop:1961 length:1110 start_codon:yes stop_codon:yes gene_type:complete
MSRTLKRPMFRDGGRANSKGTGIMSGIEDREPYRFGALVNKGMPVNQAVPTITPGMTILDILDRGQSAKIPYNISSDSTVSGATGKPSEGQSSFRSQQDPEVYTPPTEEKTSSTIDLATQMEKGAKRTFKEPKPNTIDLEDIDSFEEEMNKKAELFKKALLEDKSQTLFRGITKGGLRLLEGDTTGAVEEITDEISKRGDLEAKAKLLGLQSALDIEKIEKAAALKETGSESLKKFKELTELYPNMPIKERVAISFGSQFQKKEAPEDVRRLALLAVEEEGNQIERAFKFGAATGYELYASDGISSVDYALKDRTQSPKDVKNLVDNTNYLPGKVYWDYVFEDFTAVNQSGVDKNFKNKQEALEFAKTS